MCECHSAVAPGNAFHVTVEYSFRSPPGADNLKLSNTTRLQADPYEHVYPYCRCSVIESVELVQVQHEGTFAAHNPQNIGARVYARPFRSGRLAMSAF